jgi:hypothetical protein
LFVLGLSVQKQRLVAHGGRSYDVLAVEDAQTGRTGEAYFDVTELFDEEGRMPTARRQGTEPGL